MPEDAPDGKSSAAERDRPRDGDGQVLRCL